MVTKSGSKSKSATFSEAAAMVVRRACGARALPVLIHHITYSTRSGVIDTGGCVLSSVAFAQACKTSSLVCSLACVPHATQPCLAMMADESVADAASPEPSEPTIDEDFWRHVDSIFSDLTAEDGVEVGNIFWIGVPEETSAAKLVIQMQGSARFVVRSVRALLQEDESPFVGGKLLVNGDVLVILYLRRGAQPDADLLHDVAES